MFGNAIFELIDAEDPDKLEFGEFLQAVMRARRGYICVMCCTLLVTTYTRTRAKVVTYCCFEEIEVLQFCFFIFDRDKQGYIDQDELKFFVDVLHQQQQV